MSESTTLTKKDEEKALATYAHSNDRSADLDKDSYAIPRIALVEKLSPELEEGDAAYIEGAKPGMLVNKVMGTLCGDNFLVIPVYRRRVFLEWVPRKLGGGFVAEHNIVDGEALLKTTTRNDKNIDMLDNGNELHNVLEFYVLASEDDGASWSPAIISMSRTRMAEGKKWNMRIENFTCAGKKIDPLAQVYPLGAASRDNPEGVSYVFKVGDAKFLPEVATTNHPEVYTDAGKFLDAILQGQAQVDRAEEAGTQTGDAAPAENF